MIVADIITFIKNRLRKRVLSHQFFLVLTILKTRGSFKNDQFLVKKKKKLKSLHKYRPVSNGATFSTKFVLDAKVKVGVLAVSSNLGLCGNSLALNVSLKSD